jgi:hypothetical protein
VAATRKAVAAVLAVSEQFVTGQIRLGAEVATGAVEGAAMVAQVAIEDTTTFRTDATDVKAGSLAEAGGEYSMVAEDCTGGTRGAFPRKQQFASR